MDPYSLDFRHLHLKTIALITFIWQQKNLDSRLQALDCEYIEENLDNPLTKHISLNETSTGL